MTQREPQRDNMTPETTREAKMDTTRDTKMKIGATLKEIDDNGNVDGNDN